MSSDETITRADAFQILGDFHHRGGSLNIKMLRSSSFEGTTDREVIGDWLKYEYGGSPNAFLAHLVTFATGEPVQVEGLPDERTTCPCCGFKTLTQARGEFDICPLCEWEDDGNDRPDVPLSPNYGSMYEYRHALSRSGKAEPFHRWQCGSAPDKWKQIFAYKDYPEARFGREFLMEFTSGRAQKHLERVLQLPARGDEQDWEIELANETRLEEFIARYPEFEADDEFAFAMVALIIASFDERLGWHPRHTTDQEYADMARDADFDVERFYTESERQLWKQIAGILKSRLCLFDRHIHYWSCDEDWRSDAGPSAFPCTLFFRNEFCNPAMQSKLSGQAEH